MSRTCACVAALLAAAAAAQAAGVWWNRLWPYRREVTVGAYKPTRLGGGDLAVVTMPTGGHVRADGADVRVATVGRNEVPCRVLMVGPGDRVRVAFEIHGTARQYYVYFGHPKPPAPSQALDIRRGVLLEAWEYPGGGIKTLQQVQGVFGRVRRLVGRDFRSHIFLGHNPFGPQSRLASRFTGWLVCDKPGAYEFACSSQDASFLLVDDKQVVANGGHHGPQRDISRRGSIQLTKGLHKVTFYHVNVTGNPIAVAAWKPPGGSRTWTIPAAAFAPIFRARPGAMEQYGKSVGVDFLPRWGGEVFVRNRYYQRWAFEALPVGRLGRRTEMRWDFGDGQTAVGAKVEHVYLVAGQYAVTVAATASRTPVKQTHRIFVSRPWDQVTRNRLDPLSRQAQLVAAYDFAALSPEANAHAILLLERAKATAALQRAGAALVRRRQAPANLLAEALPLFAESVEPKQAVQAFVQGARMTRNPAVRASFVEQAGRAALDRLGDTQQAMTLFQRAVREFAATVASRTVRQAKIGIGDVWRVRGDYDEARKAYQAAGLGERVNVARLAITKGDHARHVEARLRKGDYVAANESAEQWAGDIPLDKLEGYWSLLMVRLRLAQRRPEEAVGEAKLLVKVNPGSNYAPQLLMLAADGYRKLSKDAEARAALRRIVEKYPESPLAAEAAKRLKP